MNIREEREKALGIIAEYERICELLEDGETYASYTEQNDIGPNVIVVLNAKDQLTFLDKVETMTDDEIERIHQIPVYTDDMRIVKDIKDKYGFTWNQIKSLRGGVEREPMTVTQMREALGLNKAQFSRQYDIPPRTLESWETGERQPAPYVLKLLERAVREDLKK